MNTVTTDQIAAQNVRDTVDDDMKSLYRASKLRYDYPDDWDMRMLLVDVAFLARSHMRRQIDHVTLLEKHNRITEETADMLREYIEARIAEAGNIPID